MSPERRPSTRQTRNQAEMQRRLHAKPTFGNLYDIWEMAAANSEDPSELFRLNNNRLLLREYFEAVLSTTTGNHKRMRRFRSEYEPEGKLTYDKELVKYMKRTRSSVLDPKSRRR